MGFPQEAAADAVAGIFGVFASGNLIYRFVKTGPVFDWKKAVLDANWWNNINVVVLSFLSGQDVEGIVQALQQALQSALGGNWNGVLIAAGSLLTIIWKLIQNRKEENEPRPSDASANPKLSVR